MIPFEITPFTALPEISLLELSDELPPPPPQAESNNTVNSVPIVETALLKDDVILIIELNLLD